MAKCWEQRGCDDAMQADCLHFTTFHDTCPSKCAFASCHLATHVVSSDADLIFDPTVDRTVAIKDNCTWCEFFLKNGPRVGAGV
jgi:hypothetical protein